MKILGIIPARYASTRLPGKPLALIHGKPMIQRVFEQASKALDDVIAATDDERIFATVKAFGGTAVMTSDTHTNGSSRCYEAYLNFKKESGKDFDIIINIQGDEPYIAPEQIKSLAQLFTDNPKLQIGSLMKKIEDYHEIFDPNRVKIVTDIYNFALYFSRSPIPYLRKDIKPENWLNEHTFYKHIGIYAYRADILRQLIALKPSSLESAESLEQNKWIENGFKIKLEETDTESFSIDTEKDLNEINKK